MLRLLNGPGGQKILGLAADVGGDIRTAVKNKRARRRNRRRRNNKRANAFVKSRVYMPTGQVMRNVATNVPAAIATSRVKSSKLDRSQTIHKLETLFPIYDFDDPTNIQISIMPYSFPAGYIEASQFQRFYFENIRFYYRPIKSTSQPGIVHMAIQSDPDGVEPNSVQEISAMPDYVSSSAYVERYFSLNMSHLDHSLKTFRIRSTSTAGSLNTYSQGRFNLMVEGAGGTGTNKIATLSVEYTMKVLDPMYNPDVNTDSMAVELDTPTAVAPLGITDWEDANFPYLAANSFAFNRAGRYALSFYLVGTAVNLTATLDGVAITSEVNKASTDGTLKWYTFFINAVLGKPNIVVLNATTSTGVTATTMFIHRIGKSLSFDIL